MKSQLEFVKDRLLQNGRISRNECLQNFISRLSGRILDLKQAGWEIEGDWEKTEHGKDFVYFLIKSPLKKVEYHVADLGKVITLFQ